MSDDQRMEELYRLPLAEFTAARDALAARLKSAGDKGGAAAAKGLRRPSVAAWAANQVVWQAAAEWQRLQQASGALRDAHQHAASAEELRAAGREQREALQQCEARASELLERDGHAVGPGLLQKVGGTLLALSYGVPGATPGRLEQELQPPGFEVMAGLTLAAPTPARSRPASSPRPSPEPASSAAGETPAGGAVAAASNAAAERRAREEERQRRRDALKAAESRERESRRALDEARARLAAGERRCDELERELEAARRASDETRRALAAAEAEHAGAQAALREAREEDD